MEERYLIVSSSVLPEYFEQVVRAEELINSADKSISQACSEVGISRSTFYKYRNKVFRPDRDYGKKCILAFKMIDEKGVLNRILSVIYEFGINIRSINQGSPIKNYAYVTITIDLSETDGDVQEITKRLKQVNGLKSVNVIAFE
ncbi:MAG: ACT domain-containing protein [Clostridia bacterium]|nr:ACT domain-containing protein [Clostridia bacterium]